jgi:hypothetical protein
MMEWLTLKWSAALLWLYCTHIQTYLPVKQIIDRFLFMCIRRCVKCHVYFSMWPPNAKLPRSAPGVLNGHCRARLDMSRSSLGVVLRGLPARGRSVTFPVWRKRCISPVCKVPRVLFNICVCERKLIFLCRVLSFIFHLFGMVRRKLTIPERWQAVGMHQWCGFKSRRGKNKNSTALKSNSNTVWFNFQMYIYIYMYIT